MRLRDVITTRVDYLFYVVLLVDGQHGHARFVVRCVEGDGEVDLPLLVRKTVDLGNQPHRRNGETTGAEIVSGSVIESIDRLHRVVVIMERFAHAHKDDVGHDLVPFFQHARVIQHLRDNLAAREMAFEPHLSRRAKDTSHRATRLR